MNALANLKAELDDLTTFRHGQPWRNAGREVLSAVLLPMILMIGAIEFIHARTTR